MTPQETQQEILKELKKILDNSSTLQVRLDAHEKELEKHYNLMQEYSTIIKIISAHETKLTGILWIIGLMVTVFMYKNFGPK